MPIEAGVDVVVNTVFRVLMKALEKTRTNQRLGRNSHRRYRASAMTLAGAVMLAVITAAAPAAVANPEQAAEKARTTTGGRVLAVTPSNDPNRPGYHVKVLLADGRVRIVYVP